MGMFQLFFHPNPSPGNCPWDALILIKEQDEMTAGRNCGSIFPDNVRYR